MADRVPDRAPSQLTSRISKQVRREEQRLLAPPGAAGAGGQDVRALGREAHELLPARVGPEPARAARCRGQGARFWARSP